MREKEQQASAVPPCIHTLETGKHEWNTLHSVHQANARYWFKQCPTCGWIDTEDFAREVLQAHASLVQEMEKLADHWRDPEFWRDRGATMDSMDCAADLLALLRRSAATGTELK